jgi:uncharacterized protein (DUF302 family)
LRAHLKIEGVINIRSAFNVVETMDRIESVVWARCMKVFARIDRQHEAKLYGLDMKPMQLLIFDDPRTSVRLMEECPSTALDLPLKVLVWETSEKEVWVSCYSTSYLSRRHGVDESHLPRVEALIRKALE